MLISEADKNRDDYACATCSHCAPRNGGSTGLPERKEFFRYVLRILGDEISAPSGITGDVHGTPPYAVYRVELNRKSLPAAFHIRFGCDTRDPTKVCREVVGVEHTQNSWVAWDSPDQTPLPEAAHIEVRELRSVNGIGAVRLQSDTTGNEERRARTLGFCLTSPNGATLSGVTFIDALFGKHKSVEPEVMKLLRSINFTGQNAFNSDTAELERRNQ